MRARRRDVAEEVAPRGVGLRGRALRTRESDRYAGHAVARGVGDTPADVDGRARLVAVEHAVAVGVDAQATAATRQDAHEGQLAAGARGVE
jgi:hypothetical protein